MRFESIKHRIGQHFLPALINGDVTGLDDYEAMQLSEWWDGASASWRDADDNLWVCAHVSALHNTENEFALCEVTSLRGATVDVLVNFFKEN